MMRVDTQRMAVDIPARDTQVRTEYEPAEVKPNKEAKKVNNHVDADKLKAAVELTNEAIRITNYHLEFRLHEDSGRYQVKVVDSESKQVIREIPPESMLDFSARVKQMLDAAIGILVDETA